MSDSIADVNPHKRPRYNRDAASASGPVYIRANESQQNRLEAAASYIPVSTTEEGERFQSNLSEVVTAEDTQEGLPIMIPADKENIGEVLNADWGATANFIFALVNEKPTAEATRVTIVGYLHQQEAKMFATGQLIIYRTPASFLVPKGVNDTSIKTLIKELGIESITSLYNLRQRGYNPVEKDQTGGLYTVERGIRQIGLFGIPDLDNVPRPCSGKSEGIKRMIKVGGMIRLMGWERVNKMVLDLNYSHKFFMTTCERFEETAANLPVESAFKTFGKLGHVTDLEVCQTKAKLECILMGVYPQYDRSVISITDFLGNTSNKTSWTKEPSRQGRLLFLEAFRNVEKVFTVFYGSPYKECCMEMIRALDDEENIFQHYDDIYVYIQLEIILSKFFSDIRYERLPVIFTEMTMVTPVKCALLLQRHLHEGLLQARGTAVTGNWETHPHSKFYSTEGTFRKVTMPTTLTLPVTKIDKPSTASIACCPYHLAGQLGVLTAAGAIMSCTNKSCKHPHSKLAKLKNSEITNVLKTITIKRIRDLCTKAVSKLSNK